MRSISIYALTRNQNTDSLSKLERQLSGREYFLKIREWELQSMKALVRQLESHMTKVCSLRFFYSYQIPKLGKEFDLLQIKDDQIINIELKSGAVSEEAIRKQLMQNRYYLSVLGRSIQSYTYISSQNRLVRLTNHDHIAEADWTELCGSLQKESSDYQGNIDDLFQAELYLISPITGSILFSGPFPEKRILPDFPAAGYPAPDLKETPYQPVRIFLFYRTSRNRKNIASL